MKNRINETSYFESGPLEPRSTIIIYNFATWPKDKQDRIDALDLETLFSESGFLKGNIGLRMYLEKFPEYGGKT